MSAANLESAIAAEAFTSAFTITPAAIAVVIPVVPEPVISPERVIVWFAVRYVFVSIESAPVPPDVLTNPLDVKFDRVAMFWLVLTVTVLVVRVRPVENVRGTS